MNQYYKLAKFYQEKHISIYPVLNNSKIAACRWKIYRERLPTEKELRLWFIEKEYKNMAIITGKFSNIIIIDCDDEHTIKSWEYICNKKDDTNSLNTLTVNTRRGKHFYYFYPKEDKVPTTDDFISRYISIEIKSDKASCKAPPSHYINSDEQYKFDNKYGIQNFPEWLLDDILRKTKIDKHIKELTFSDTKFFSTGEKWLRDAVNKATIGNRNKICVWLSDQLRDDGLTIHDSIFIVNEYRKLIPQSDSDPYTYNDAIATLRSRYQLPKRPPAKKI